MIKILECPPVRSEYFYLAKILSFPTVKRISQTMQTLDFDVKLLTFFQRGKFWELAAALATAIEKPSMALAPNLFLLAVPSNSIKSWSIFLCSNGFLPEKVLKMSSEQAPRGAVGGAERPTWQGSWKSTRNVAAGSLQSPPADPPQPSQVAKKLFGEALHCEALCERQQGQQTHLKCIFWGQVWEATSILFASDIFKKSTNWCYNFAIFLSKKIQKKFRPIGRSSALLSYNVNKLWQFFWLLSISSKFLSKTCWDS